MREFSLSGPVFLIPQGTMSWQPIKVEKWAFLQLAMMACIVTVDALRADVVDDGANDSHHLECLHNSIIIDLFCSTLRYQRPHTLLRRHYRSAISRISTTQNVAGMVGHSQHYLVAMATSLEKFEKKTTYSSSARNALSYGVKIAKIGPVDPEILDKIGPFLATSYQTFTNGIEEQRL